MCKTILNLLISTTAVGGMYGPALASEMEGAPAAANEVGEEVAQPGQPEDSQSGEIIVTAQRREERLRDIPITISQFGEETLANMKADQIWRISAQVPGITIKSSFGEQSPLFVFRGIGTNDASAINTQTVSAYVDGVLKPYNVMLGGALFDMERVEVLKGPQGTLYGSNNTGGSINFISKKPTMETTGKARVDFSSFNTLDYEAAIGGQVAHNTSARIAFFGKNRTKGYQYNIFHDTRSGEMNSYGGRFQLLWEPNDRLEILFGVSGTYSKDDTMLYAQVSTQDPNFAFGGPPAVLCEPALRGHRDETQCSNFLGISAPSPNLRIASANNSHSTRIDGKNKNIHKGAGAFFKLTVALDGMTITSQTSYDKFKRKYDEDSDQSPLQILEGGFRDDLNSFTHETILASDINAEFKFLLGGNFHYDKNNGSVIFLSRDMLMTNLLNDFNQDVKAFGIFVNGAWEFSPHWTLSGGLRYTHEVRRMKDQKIIDLNTYGTSLLTQPASFCAVLGLCGVAGTGFDDLVAADPVFGQGILAQLHNRKLKTSDVSGELSLKWEATPDVTMFGKVSSGFKSGAFTGIVAFSQADLEPAKNEKIYAGEFGIKSLLFDRAFTLNASTFYMKWKDFIAQLSVSNPPGAFPMVNAGDAEIYGVEIESNLNFRGSLEGLSVSNSIAYLHAEITKTNPGVSVDLTGNRLHSAPRWKYSGAVDYTMSSPVFGDGGFAFAHVDYNYETSKFFEVQNIPVIKSHSKWLVNGRVGFGDEEAGWRFSVWSRNLFNKKYFMDMFNFVETTGSGLGQPGFPREVGASLEVNF